MNPLGSVIYGTYKGIPWPIGIVSENGDRKAILKECPEELKNMLIEIEDKRFYSHKGFDMQSILRAAYQNIRKLKIVEGGSTLTQQLARNIFRDNRKTLYRKVKEIYEALKIERQLSKNEILQKYLNEVYWGKNLYGLRAASLNYFAKEPEDLSNQEQLILITLLRGPNLYFKNHEALIERLKLLNTLLLKRKLLFKKEVEVNTFKPNLQNNKLIIFKESVVPFITQSFEVEKFRINTYIIKEVQTLLDKYVKAEKYPTSAVLLLKGNVVACSSSYGIEHIFNFKCNVGSTLKPFIYTFLRKNNISKDKTIFSNNFENENWRVREIYKNRNKNLSLQDALFYSHNNTFITACKENNLENDTLIFLADILNISINNFYSASILGATKKGISIYELCLAYSTFFADSIKDDLKQECLEILGRVFKHRLKVKLSNQFLKTGTTNNNEQRLAVLGTPEYTLAILREENPIDDFTKDGSFLQRIGKKLSNPINKFFSVPKDYKWKS